MRPNQEEYFMKMAFLVAERSTCLSRRVGCVLVGKNKNILSTGYNGIPRDLDHCTSATCVRKVPGKNLDMCVAVHAEQNALLQCPDVDKIVAAYITVSPCLSCTAMLLNTSCEIIVFREGYANYERPKELWEKAGRVWRMAAS